MKTTLSKYLLFEYLSGRANPLERQLVEAWIINKENAETYYEWLMEYELKSPQFIPDHDAAIAQLLQRVESDHVQEDARINENALTKSWFTWRNNRLWLIAASIILLVTSGWLLREPILFKTYQTGYGQTTDIYLEDGSKVALNANSSLRIPRFGFQGKVREVRLEGEAEFSVSHTIDHKRFVVKTAREFQVEVLGTTFSVFARPRGSKVALTSGSVRIDYASNNTQRNVMMEPGDLAFLDKTGKVQLEKKQDVKTFAPWKEQRYVFDGTSVGEIAAMIEENFGQQVSLSDSTLASRTITGNFKTKDAEELLKTISAVLDVKFEQNGSAFVLTNN